MLMKKRNKVAIFIDYAIRNPGFIKTYAGLKQYMFEVDTEEYEVEGHVLLRDFWKEEIKTPEIAEFYSKSIPPENESEIKDWSKFFYNEIHLKKFLQDYSFNLYVQDAEVPNGRDLEVITLVNNHLFDVVLVDEVWNDRKKANTLFYLSKLRVSFQSLVFLKDGETLDESEYIGVWNPKANSEQINGPEYMEFEGWCKDLETKYKNEQFG
jgi:hypothetical protein